MCAALADLADEDQDDAEDMDIADTPLAAFPTDARPGSLDKVRVMEGRYRLRVALFHPLDAGGPCASPRDPAELADFLRPRRRTYGRTGRVRRDGRRFSRGDE
jgi:hypothetical protein